MKIFISHSSRDKWIARQLSALLKEAGHTSFLDEKDIKTGDSIDASIQKHLKESDQLLLLLSPSSIDSHWVFIELGGAKALGKKVIPILLHLEANEVPAPISQLLARDINEFDKYLGELKQSAPAIQPPTETEYSAIPPTDMTPPVVSAPKTAGMFAIGMRVKIVNVEHLTEKDKAESPKWIAEMNKYSGMESQIVRFTPKNGWAYLAVDDGEFKWSLKWLTKLE